MFLELQTMVKDHKCRIVQFSCGSWGVVNSPFSVSPVRSPSGGPKGEACEYYDNFVFKTTFFNTD